MGDFTKCPIHKLIPTFNKKNNIKDRSQDVSGNIRDTLAYSFSHESETGVFNNRLIYVLVLQRFVDKELPVFEGKMRGLFKDGKPSKKDMYNEVVMLFGKKFLDFIKEDFGSKNYAYMHNDDAVGRTLEKTMVDGLRTSLMTTLGFIDVYRYKSLKQQNITFEHISYLVGFMSTLHQNAFTAVEAKLRNLSYNDFIIRAQLINLFEFDKKYPYDPEYFMISTQGKLKFSEDFTISISDDDINLPHDKNRTKCIANAVKVNKGTKKETSFTTYLCTLMTELYTS